VRGFAVVLCLGILTSMFSAVTVSRAMANLTYGRQPRLDENLDLRHQTMIEFFPFKKTIPFMSWGKATTAISLLTFLFSVWALWDKGLNLGVDFTGGTVIEVSYDQTANLPAIRAALEKPDCRSLGANLRHQPRRADPPAGQGRRRRRANQQPRDGC
jgi:preprotein translocase subunit SecD